MKCDACCWGERPGFVRRPDPANGIGSYMVIPCPVCNGSTIASCCEVTQPDDDLVPIDPGQ